MGRDSFTTFPIFVYMMDIFNNKILRKEKNFGKKMKQQFSPQISSSHFPRPGEMEVASLR